MLQGVRHQAVQSLETIEPDQFQKWHTGNEIWYMALVDRHPPPSDETPNKLPAGIQAVISDYSDVFGEPKKLPPHQQYHHAITLVEDA